MERVVTKTIELENRKFVVRKFDPMFGAYISLQIFSSIDHNGDKFNLEGILNKMVSKKFEEFKEFQNKILAYCSEILPAGNIPVINSEGNIAINNLSPILLLQLVMNTLMFSMEDFFTEGEEAPQT